MPSLKLGLRKPSEKPTASDIIPGGHATGAWSPGKPDHQGEGMPPSFMSNTIRELLLERQAGSAVDPEMLSDGELVSLYQALLGQSMTSGVTDQYGPGQNLQNSLNQGDSSQLMRPMISSVMQLDR